MATNYTPKTTVKLYSGVPLDDSYTDVRWIPGGNIDGFLSSYQVKEYSALSYQRPSSSVLFSNFRNTTNPRRPYSVRVEENAENLYNVNYLSFNNGARTFYAFVKSVNWVSENTTELIYMIDWFHTYMDTAYISACFVVREHYSAAEDQPFANLEPEPIGVNLYKVDGTPNEWTIPTDSTIIVQLAPSNPIMEIILGQAQATCWGGFFGGPYVVTFPNTQAGATQCQAFLDTLAVLANINDCVRDIFVVPQGPLRGDGPVRMALGGTNVQNLSFQPAGEAGYTARNKKLLCSQFCKIISASSQGDHVELLPELFDSPTAFFAGYESRGMKYDAIAFPTNYNGLEDNFYESVSYSEQIQVPWAAGSGVFGAIAKITPALLSLGLSAMTGGAVPPIPLSPNSPSIGGGGASAQIPAVSATNTAAQLPGAQAINFPEPIPNTADMSAGRLPAMPALRLNYGGSGGHAAGNGVLSAAGKGGFINYRLCPCNEDLVKIDRFFDLYGYASNRYKLPNTDTRTEFNYLQLKDPHITCDGPEQAIETYKRVFANGVRLWHTDLMKNFSLENSAK